VLTVCDEGPGIAQETVPHVFERFHRGENASASSGIGLGLAIAKALVEIQSGTITVESQVDQGSTFVVTLPRAIPD
jgi:two-component system phosphate regulon sensor histidine kinase PhoR